MSPHTPKIKTLGVYTSGGDAPGMNAAIRAVVRYGLYHGLKIKGIMQGYMGMLNNNVADLDLGAMANVIQRGGTLLKTGRSKEFINASARKTAAENLKKNGIEGLVCIGGDGSFRGAHLLSQEHGLPVIGVPGTIDNDIFGTEYTIGFDTAINIAMESIDRIRDTAASHDRLFIVEVMGRSSGSIAAAVGLAGGAEEIFFPQSKVSTDEAIEHIKRGISRGKTSSILVTAEGDQPGAAYRLAEEIKKKAGFDSKVCILGHVQRGGNPTALDRIWASRLGAYAVEMLLAGHSGQMTAVVNNKMTLRPLEEVYKNHKAPEYEMVELAQILST